MHPPAGPLPRIRPLGDAALLVELSDVIGADAHDAVRAACAALETAFGSAAEIVPAYTSIAVHYDPVHIARAGVMPHDAVRVLTEEALRNAGPASAAPARTIEITVRYGGSAGPDLELVARHSGLAADEVVRRHAAALYTVHFIGFVPGFPYLAGMPAELATPRRESPRERVPAGSVAIAGEQTGIYPFATPGGWNLIGRTDAVLFRPDDEPPTLLRLGDRVRFIPAA